MEIARVVIFGEQRSPSTRNDWKRRRESKSLHEIHCILTIPVARILFTVQ